MIVELDSAVYIYIYIHLSGHGPSWVEWLGQLGPVGSMSGCIPTVWLKMALRSCRYFFVVARRGEDRKVGHRQGPKFYDHVIAKQWAKQLEDLACTNADVQWRHLCQGPPPDEIKIDWNNYVGGQ